MINVECFVDQHDVSNGTYKDIYSLECGNEEDQNRFKLFFELLKRFTKNVTETHLDIMKKRHPHIYENCSQLYAFHLETEDDENQAWVKMYFPTYRKYFSTNNISHMLKTKWIVSNIIRHCFRWINNHYQLDKPMMYQNIEALWPRKDGGSKLTNVNFISF